MSQMGLVAAQARLVMPPRLQDFGCTPRQRASRQLSFAVHSKKAAPRPRPPPNSGARPVRPGGESAGPAAPVPSGGGRAAILGSLKSVDLEAVRGVEINGNQVILTLDDGASGSDDPEGGPDAQISEEQRVMDAVVKIFCVHTEPNYSLPWQRKRQYASTSSGFMVETPGGGRGLLTNAHSVEFHSQVKVKRRGDDRKFLARVLAIGTECDIALLTVEDEEFWSAVGPVHFGPLPALQDSVYGETAMFVHHLTQFLDSLGSLAWPACAVVGYPIGGDTISMTSGVVSRIEVTAYAHGNTELLAVQIDAAINSGNSGGPVFNERGDCVGIAFQSYAGSDAENIG